MDRIEDHLNAWENPVFPVYRFNFIIYLIFAKKHILVWNLFVPKLNQ